MDVITSLKDAQFLLNCSVISVDIETQTTAPHEGWGSKFGFSYCAPVTWIALHAEGYPVVVFDLQDSIHNHSRAEIPQIRTFISSVLSRPHITIIGHNATFDMRNLGGHFNFRVHLDSNVWDTLTMAILLLMAEAEDSETSLKSLIEKYRLLNKDDLAFSAQMKEKRGVLDGEISSDVLRYVALDALATTRLYRLQKEVIASSPNPKIEPRFDAVTETWELAQVETGNRFVATKSWKNLFDLVKREQRISRMSANMAIDGVRLDKDYVYKHLEQLTVEYSQDIKAVMGKADPTCYTGFDLHFCTLLWYRTILDSLFDGRNPTKLDISKWYYWQGAQGSVIPEQIVLRDRLRNQISPEDEAAWKNYLLNFPNEPVPTGSIPSLSLFTFVHAACRYSEVEYGWYRTYLKTKWFEDYYMMRKPVEPSALVNKPLFKRYYVFCVEEKSFPTHDDIVSMPELVTGETYDMALKHLEDMMSSETLENEVLKYDPNAADVMRPTETNNINLTQIALERDELSLGENALEFYFPKEHKDDDDHPFVTVSNHRAKINRIEEFLRHAELDGRIHSIIARKTRTGRATSTSMNLQNINMKFFRGYLVADTDDRILGSVDVSNAENWFASLTFADNNLALACAGGDFHAANTRAYWPEKTRELDARMAAGDKSAFDEFAALRKLSKFVTFGGAYGAGADKISRMVGCSYEDAKTILENRDKHYPMYAEGKKLAAKRAENCYKQGIKPPFTTLWTGRRISVPFRTTKQGVEVAGYKCANYLQQGGVGELIWRAMVEATEFFEREGWDVKIPLQVHDEIIFDCSVDIFFQVAQKIIQIIADVVPEEYLNRTVPACRFLSEVGIENSKKWGWRYNKVYPIDPTLFVNRWGVFTLPEGETEAPTWVGDYSNGYTLEGEIMAANSSGEESASKESIQDAPVTTKIEVTPQHQWRELGSIIYQMQKIHPAMYELSLEQMGITINGDHKGVFDFEEWMLIQQELFHKGHDNFKYREVLDNIRYYVSVANELVEWSRKYDK